MIKAVPVDPPKEAGKADDKNYMPGYGIPTLVACMFAAPEEQDPNVHIQYFQFMGDPTSYHLPYLFSAYAAKNRWKQVAIHLQNAIFLGDGLRSAA